jgi:putative DNA primase/helicase
MAIDFKKLNESLNARAVELLNEWYPNGKLKGREYTVGSVDGESGKSLSINVETGVWKDFNGTDAGGDLISLYAAKYDMEQGEAARSLMSDYGYVPVEKIVKWKKHRDSITPGPAPHDATLPVGPNSQYWTYRDVDGNALFIVERKGGDNGSKSICQWTWDTETGAYKPMSHPAPRPLYNLHKLYAHDKAKVIVVEGEKCAEALGSLLGPEAVVTTWACGASSVSKSDWSPVAGRDVIVWPDADRAGYDARDKIMKTLDAIGCTVKHVDVDDKLEKHTGWDVADLIESGADIDAVRKFIKPRIRDYKPKTDVVVHSPSDNVIEVSTTYADIWSDLGLQVNKAGSPVPNLYNATLVLDRVSGDKFQPIRMDEFSGRVMYGDRDLTDADVIQITGHIQSVVGIASMQPRAVWDAVIGYASLHRINPVTDMIDSYEWDGKQRIDTFFQDSCGSGDNEYTRAVSKNFWISMVARCYHPGCKVDTMVIMEGKQGAKKSTMLRKIASDRFYTEINQSCFEGKDYILSMRGNIIVEMGELNTFNRSKVEAMKQFLATQKDRIREPYAKLATSIPRSSVFVGTTNGDEYLVDITGGRRFWPIECPSISTEYVDENREQLFAEARSRMQAGESWWEVPESAAEVQESRTQQDDWIGVISEWLSRRGNSGVKIREIAQGALNIPIEKLDGVVSRRIARCLRSLGLKRRTVRNGNHVENLYVKNTELEF